MKLKEKYWHEFFVVGIVIKTLTGLVETASGFILLFISPDTLSRILIRLGNGGQPVDSDDWMLAYAHQYLMHLTTGTKIFAGLYILSHGLINLGLAYNLLKEKLWAYLVGLGVLISFMAYQLYRISYTHSVFLEVLTALDVFFVFVIWHEYKYQVRRLGKKDVLAQL